MTQAIGKTKVVISMTPSGSNQQSGSRFARYTKDASDASLAQFERLMIAMGYRRLESTDRQAA